ncbi:MAG: YqjF family protein [Terriglobales bacterium]
MAKGHVERLQPSGIFLTAEWCDLAILNYEVDPSLLRKLVPSGTELDSWNGKTFISLVGFRFLKTKVRGVSLPFHRNFEEVNLRFYVRRSDGNQVKRGVVFIREIVPRWLIAAVARIVYNERYVALPMEHAIERNGSALTVEYEWKRGISRNRISVTAKGSPVLPASGSQEQFITEHYWGYAAQKDGGCIEYQVEHPPWKVWATAKAMFEGAMKELYGRELDAVLKRPPYSAFLAEGSNVSVHRGRRL